MNFFLVIFTTFWTMLFANAKTEIPWKTENGWYSHRTIPLDLIAQYLPYNPVIFEAGGHYGIDTMKLSRKWFHSTIISFEPNPHAFEKLVKVSQQRLNIIPYELAVADFNGPGVFYVCHGTNGDDPIFEGASSLLPASEFMQKHYQGPILNVNCVILDDWCKDNNISKIDFMWLDLEGMELQVLKASPNILKTVSVIYTETNFMEFRVGMTQYSDLKKFLEDNGFELLEHWYQEGLQGNAIFFRKDLCLM